MHKAWNLCLATFKVQVGHNSGLCLRYCCEGAWATGGISEIKVDDRSFEALPARVNVGVVGARLVEVQKFNYLPEYDGATSSICQAGHWLWLGWTFLHSTFRWKYVRTAVYMLACTQLCTCWHAHTPSGHTPVIWAFGALSIIHCSCNKEYICNTPSVAALLLLTWTLCMLACTESKST